MLNNDFEENPLNGGRIGGKIREGFTKDGEQIIGETRVTAEVKNQTNTTLLCVGDPSQWRIRKWSRWKTSS